MYLLRLLTVFIALYLTSTNGSLTDQDHYCELIKVIKPKIQNKVKNYNFIKNCYYIYHKLFSLFFFPRFYFVSFLFLFFKGLRVIPALVFVLLGHAEIPSFFAIN